MPIRPALEADAPEPLVACAPPRSCRRRGRSPRRCTAGWRAATTSRARARARAAPDRRPRARRVVGHVVERERRVAVGAERAVGVEGDPPRPAQHADVEVEDASRVAAGEEDREERDDRQHEKAQPEEDEHDVVRDREEPLDEPEPAAQRRRRALPRCAAGTAAVRPSPLLRACWTLGDQVARCTRVSPPMPRTRAVSLAYVSVHLCEPPYDRD